MQTHKKSLLHKLLILIITLMISMFVIPTFVSTLSTTVHAEGYDFDEGDPAAKGSASLLGGPTWARSGVEFYLVDEYGKYVGLKPVMYTTLYDGFVDRNGNQLSPANIRVSSRMFSLSYDRLYTGAIDKWGPPWGEGGNLRGVEIREWLTTTEGEHTRAANLIAGTWGTEWAKKYENKEVFLVFEAVGWNNIYCNGVNTGECIAGPAKFWAFYYSYLQAQGLSGPKGDSKINLYTHDIYQHCMILTGAPETEKMGLKPTPTRSGKQESDFLMHYMNGWGMGVVWCEPNAINTYSEEEGSPGKAEDPIKDPTKAGTKNIVKGYYTENETTGEKTSNGVFIQRGTSKLINIMDEPEYQVVQWDMSMKDPTVPNPTDWHPPIFMAEYANGTEPTTVDMPPHAKTLYVLLKKVEAEEEESDDSWIIEESEITKSVETGDKIKDKTITVTLPNLQSCDGHTKTTTVDASCSDVGCTTPDCPGDHTKSSSYTVHCDSWTLSDKKFSLITKNTNEDDKTTSRHVLAKDSNFEVKHEKNPSSDDRSGTTESTKDTKGYNYKFVLHRFNKDKLALLNYEPSPKDIGKIQTLGSQYSIQKLDAKPRKTRKTEEYVEKLKLILDIDFAKSSDKSTAAKGDEGCYNAKDITSSNNTIEYTGDVTIKTYSGMTKEPDGFINTSDMMTIGNATTSGRMIQSGGSVTFQPFISMTYDTLDTRKQEVYVLSEWKRQVIPNDYAEISWTKVNENLRITSNQWSTHADSLRLSGEIHGTARTNCMLPGGAVYSLDMKDNSGNPKSQKIVLTTYQTIVEGKARQYSNLASDSSLMTDATAQDEHQAFVDGAAGMLDGTLVEMWVNKDPKASAAWASGGIKVGPAADISALNNGSTIASSDPKYYLTPDSDNYENASRSDIDVKVTDRADIYYRIWSDTYGNIRYAKGNSLGEVTGVSITGGTPVLSKGQDASALSGELRNIDNRTKAVTKYVEAIERNTGNDTTAPWAGDGAWYNEAWYGIIVVVQTSEIECAFYAPDMRTTIMDPKLVPKINKKNEPMKAFLFQYKTALPLKAPLSTFKGKAIYMNNADMLFNSQKFYILSQTVQDLS